MVGFEFTVEGSRREFLGIQLERLPNNSFVLTQPGLISKILKTTEHDTLGRDPDGEDHDEPWRYNSLSECCFT